MGQSRSMGSSAFRRNTAELLGFATSSDIKQKRVCMTGDQLAVVCAWILGCSVAWIDASPSAFDR